MRILLFLHSFEPGGVEAVALRLARAWSMEGAVVDTVIGRDEGPCRPTNLEFTIMPRGRISSRPFETLWMIARLPAYVRRLRPDILFCAGNTYAIVAVAMKLLLGRHCPPIAMKVSNDLVRADLPLPFRLAYQLWLRLQGRWIDRFVGMAEPMRIEIALATGVAADRIAIVEDPAITLAEIADLQAQRSRAVAAGPGRRYLAVGRLVRQKNFTALLHAFATIAAADDRLTILGDGPERHRIERLARRLRIADRVALPGHADPKAGWLAGADMFVLSSDYEGVPAVIVEALAVGLPIVATDCSVSMAWLLGRGRFGTLVPVGDVPALARAMADAGTAAKARGRFPQEDDRAVHAARFAVERVASRYRAVLDDVVRRRSPAACGIVLS